MDGLLFLMSIVGTGLVLWWVIRNDRAGPGDPTVGLFAMPHDKPGPALPLPAGTRGRLTRASPAADLPKPQPSSRSGTLRPSPVAPAPDQHRRRP
jgi:hypothetical protein